MKKKVLFIDRDGTLILEPPPTYQIDSFEKLEFYPGVFEFLGKIAAQLDYELVMVTNQDGLGTDSFPEEDFKGPHEFMMKAFRNENIHFEKVWIDRSFPHENKDTRKPAVGLLLDYINNEQYDLTNSFVIGDRITDVKLAQNLGCKAIFLNNVDGLGAAEVKEDSDELKPVIALETRHWKDVYEFLKSGLRTATISRKTNETDIRLSLNLDGTGKGHIKTGLHFFDHMLDQLARHGGLDLELNCDGDLQVDEHHTIEDTAIVLGEAFLKALGDKRGLARYGFLLPMDDALAQVAIDFGGRSWIVWNAEFKREKIGDMPTEMFYHFFKSFSDAARCNLHISVEGENEHHKIESVFKAFAKAIRMAVARNMENKNLPSTKGIL